VVRVCRVFWLEFAIHTRQHSTQNEQFVCDVWFVWCVVCVVSCFACDSIHTIYSWEWKSDVLVFLRSHYCPSIVSSLSLRTKHNRERETHTHKERFFTIFFVRLMAWLGLPGEFVVAVAVAVVDVTVVCWYDWWAAREMWRYLHFRERDELPYSRVSLSLSLGYEEIRSFWFLSLLTF